MFVAGLVIYILGILGCVSMLIMFLIKIIKGGNPFSLIIFLLTIFFLFYIFLGLKMMKVDIENSKMYMSLLIS